MPFLILFVLVLAAQPLPWPESPLGWGPRGSLIATIVATAVPVLTAFVWPGAPAAGCSPCRTNVNER